MEEPGAIHVGAAPRVALGAVVLGMGRSGTSAVTRTLVTSRFFAGRDSELLPARPENPVGFWENRAIYELNEQILQKVGATWFAPPSAEALATVAPWAAPRIRTEIARLLVEAGNAPLAVKDPRIGVLLRLWGPLIDELLHPVLVVRNPVEVALSLAGRDGTPTAFALASWELHTAGLLEYLDGRIVTVAPYAQLVSAPAAVTTFVDAVSERLAAGRIEQVDSRAAPAAVEPRLHRNRAAGETSDYLTGRQAELWAFLSTLPVGNQVLDVPDALTRANAAARVTTGCENDRLAQLRHAAALQERIAAQGAAHAVEPRGSGSGRSQPSESGVRRRQK